MQDNEILSAKKAAKDLRTPQTAQVKAETASSKAVQLHADLDKIYFDYDSSTLSEQARTTLGKISDLMRKNPAAIVQMKGIATSAAQMNTT